MFSLTGSLFSKMLVIGCAFPSKVLGPDELHFRVLKEFAGELGPVFAHLFQQSLDKGEIPRNGL